MKNYNFLVMFFIDILYILDFLLVLIGAIFILLFTYNGNQILIPYFEKVANYYVNDLNIKIVDLRLKPNYININLILNREAKVKLSGKVDIFKKYVELKYDFKIDDLSKFEKLLNRKLQKDLKAKGEIVGDSKQLVIDSRGEANSNSFEVTTLWSDLNITNPKEINLNNLTNLSFNLESLNLANLFESFNYPNYALATLDLSTQGLTFEDNQIEGRINISAKDVTIFKDSLNDFNITLKKDLYIDNLKAKVEDGLFTITLKDLNSKELIESIGEYPSFVDTNIDIIKLTHSLTKQINFIRFKSTNSTLNSKLINQKFNLTIPEDIKFTSYVGLINREEYTLVLGYLISDKLVLKIKDAIVDTNQTRFKGKYELLVNDLGELNLTKQKLVGGLKLNGEFENKNEFILKGESHDYGNISFKYKNNILNLFIKNSLLRELLYPFDLKQKFVDLNVKDSNISYDFNRESANIEMKIDSLKLLKTKFTTTFKEFLYFDFTKENFQDFLISAKLKDNIIKIKNISIVGRNSKLQFKNFTFNTLTNRLYTKLYIETKNFAFVLKIDGNIKNFSLDSIDIDIGETMRGGKTAIFLFVRALVFPIDIFVKLGTTLKTKMYDILDMLSEAEEEIGKMFKNQ